MDKNQNQIENIISSNINEDLLDIQNNKSNSMNEINNIIIIKELINSLKEKINIYEKQIKKLIDDKIKLQMDMNSIILQNLSLKKKNNSFQNIENSKEEEVNINKENNNNQILSTLIEINKKLFEQNKELKSQLDIYKSNIDIYKKKLIELKENSSLKTTKCKSCEEKKLELNKMASEKEEIFNSIKSLRKQLDELKLNEKIKKEKKRKQRIEKNESLPSIEQYFIVNNKFQLVDSNKNLWHMKKCMKFQEFKQKYEQANLSPDDLLKEFVETYEIKIDEEINEENEFNDENHFSEREHENSRKKYENKYMPPLPGMGGGANKKKIEENKIIDNINDDSEINRKNNNINIKNEEDKEINTGDINIDIKDDNENNKKENKDIKNDEIKNDNNENNLNINNNNSNNTNEIKEETSFNLSDNTD